MKRVGEEQQNVVWKSVRGEHRSHASAHRTSAENERLRPDLAASVRGHGSDAFLQSRHRVRVAGTFLAVREVETNDVKPALEKRFGHPEHAAVAHVAAGAMRENKKPAAGRCQRGLEDRRSLFRADLDPPSRSSAHDGWSRADGRYFIRSLILARAPRAHSSSNWPPGAPLTPRPPMVLPPAMMAIAPCA